MPKINLKPNSAEFADDSKQPSIQHCEMPGCSLEGEFKAPKHRGLNEYYHFCIEHVREYNKAWNYFDGLSDEEVMEQTINAMYGDRPTWKYGVNGDAEEELFKKAWQTFNNTDEEPPKYNQYNREHDPQNGQFSQYSQEHKALAVMGLAPPVTLEGIKKKYKELAKKHHPDLNGGSAESEALLKEINMAYTILKLAYEKYDTLVDK